MSDAPGALSLRPARLEDCALVFEWANDPASRRNSFSPEPIAWDTHCAWFEQTLADPNRALRLVCVGSEPIGQVRLDLRSRREAELSVSIARAWRGRGLAAAAIRLATEEAANLGIEVVHAYVKTGNETSLRAFRRAGYVEQGVIDRHSFPATHFLFAHVSRR